MTSRIKLAVLAWAVGILLAGCADTGAAPAASLSSEPSMKVIPQEVMDIFTYEFCLYSQNPYTPASESEKSIVLFFYGSDTAIRYPGGVVESNPDVFWFLDTRGHMNTPSSYDVWRICMSDMPMEQAMRYHADDYFKYGSKEIPMRQCSIMQFNFNLYEGFTVENLEERFRESITYLNDDLSAPQGEDAMRQRDAFVFQNISMEYISAMPVYTNHFPQWGDDYADPRSLTKKRFKELLQDRIKFMQEEEIIGHLPDYRNGLDSPELIYSLRGHYQYYILPDAPLPETVFTRNAPSVSILDTSLRETRVYLLDEAEEKVSVLRAFVHVCDDGNYNINFAYHMRTFPVGDMENEDMLAFHGLRNRMQTGWVKFDHEYREGLLGTGDDPYPFLEEYVGSPEYWERYGDVDVRTGEPLDD